MINIKLTAIKLISQLSKGDRHILKENIESGATCYKNHVPAIYYDEFIKEIKELLK